MSKHLNELSAVYLNNIAEETVCPVCGFDPCQCLEGTLDESCGCDHSEKKDKKKEKKEYKDPVSHALETDKKLMKIHNEGKQPIHIGRMLSQASNKDYQASKEKNPSKREKLETQARTIRTTVDMDSFKKRKSKIKPQRAGVQEGFSNWRQDLIEVSDGNFDVPSSQAKSDKEMKQEIKDKKVKNKVLINPPMAVSEAVEALGGTILEFYEMDEEKKPYPFNKVSRKASYRELEDDNLTKIRRHASHASMNALKGKGGDESAQNKMSDRIKKLRGEQGKAMKQLKQDKADGFTGAPSRKKLANLEKRRLAIKTASNQLKHQKEDVNLDEKINLKKADMGDVVKDFYKSDAPQFKGKSKEKRREMAIAAKLEAERGPQESTDMKNAPNIKDQKTPKKTNVYYDKHMKQYVPTVKEARDPAKEEQGKKIASYEKSGRAFGLIKKFRQENPGSRQPKKVPGAKETEGQAAARRRGAQAQRAAKHGLTSKEKKETQARAPYYSTRD